MLQPSAGSIQINGQNIAAQDAIALRRRIGYVIQDFGLMPHWTVERNICLVPQLLGWNEQKQKERSHELLARVGLDPGEYSGRYPNELSGGQKQRVGVARALAAEPLLLLFDEPFGALDPLTRHEMQLLFLDLRERYGGASVFVTHDLGEAITIGTRIAVLDKGSLEGVFTPHEFLNSPSPAARAFVETLPPGVHVH
jgi:osmoprotectant transport system ATP-binding protein